MSKRERANNSPQRLDPTVESRGYKHKEHDPKWTKKWAEDKIYRTDSDSEKPKAYILDMFPYPSGYGLHVGHVEGYTATDILSRYKRMKGYEVLHPMGWDAFGLPTENFAISTGKNPTDVTKENTAIFKAQCEKTGLSFDWDREVDTSSPEYYKWTQWLFLQLYNAKLAYKAEAPANFCPSCNTVIANEQAKGGICERCSSTVETKKIEQWFFNTKSYAERLIDDLDEVDWLESSKLAQRNWIGRSEGHEITFPIEGTEQELKIFTTKPGTIHGTTFMAIAPESPYVNTVVTEEYKDQVVNYVKNITPQSEIERKKTEREKTGVFTGSYAINPINNEKIPIWIADYILMDYGTGAIMGVPSLDDRDLAFAKIYNLGIREVQEDLLSEKGIKDTIDHLGNSAKEQVQYKLRDWLISRERYWGAPIPIVYCTDCGIQPVQEDQLPVILPTDITDYKPTGIPPLAKSSSFLETQCPHCNGPAQRETKTLDTFVDSAWYFLRYCDPGNNEELASKEKMEKWMPVDTYIGGTEHLAGHLLYSRFITKVLKDLGIININEPFQQLIHQGMIMGEDRRKMSKRFGNVVNPDDVINQYGADTLRMYEMFMGPLAQSKPWDSRSIIGVRKFVDRINGLTDKLILEGKPDQRAASLTDRLIYNVERDIEAIKLNTPISEFMKYVSSIEENGSIDRTSFERFLTALAPFAPFITEQLWSELGNQHSIHQQPWPEIKYQNAERTNNEIPLQINGKLRSVTSVGREFTGTIEDVLSLFESDPKLAGKISADTVRRIIYKPGRVLNIVI